MKDSKFSSAAEPFYDVDLLTSRIDSVRTLCLMYLCDIERFFKEYDFSDRVRGLGASPYDPYYRALESIQSLLRLISDYNDLNQLKIYHDPESKKSSLHLL